MERESLLELGLLLAFETDACGEERYILGATGPEIVAVVHWQQQWQQSGYVEQ
jgi:hypothetical protein